MKKIAVSLLLVFFLAPVFGGLFNPRPAFAQANPWNADARVSHFYESLRPYGEWIPHSVYGWVWRPYNIPVDWRPYTDGHWVFTDSGWTWVSDQQWGWACFHYGRWLHDQNFGWLWYPDLVWSPAWVIWREGGDWVGWAPLPPEAVWFADTGVFSDFDADDLIPWFGYSFCRHREFFAADLSRRIAVSARNVTLLKRCGIARGAIRLRDKRVVNEVPFQEKLEKELGHPFKREKSAESGPVPAAAPRPAASAQTPGLRELNVRHQEETRALEQAQVSRQRLLQEGHAQELKSAGNEQARQRLMEEHNRELEAHQKQAMIERQVMQNWHSREERALSVPNAPPHRAFSVPEQPPVSGEGEKQDRGGGRRR